jgi:hypothetical protein
MQNDTATLKDIFFSYKASHSSAILLLEIYPKELKIHAQQIKQTSLLIN